MSLNDVTPGQALPGDVNVIIEISAQSGPVKYEIDKETGALFVDRFLTTPMYYPCNYGYIPQTLAGDGDPVDVLVVTSYPLIAGSVIRTSPLGLLQMRDEAGDDNKVLAVPIPKLDPASQGIRDYTDLSPTVLDRIAHFFKHYKDLEPEKWTEVTGWGGVNKAHEEILNAVARYKNEEVVST